MGILIRKKWGGHLVSRHCMGSLAWKVGVPAKNVLVLLELSMNEPFKDTDTWQRAKRLLEPGNLLRTLVPRATLQKQIDILGQESTLGINSGL